MAEPDSHISQIYRELARKTAAKLSLQAKDYAAKFPRIVIQNNQRRPAALARDPRPCPIKAFPI